jgi:hypothetical protein
MLLTKVHQFEATIVPALPAAESDAISYPNGECLTSIALKKSVLKKVEFTIGESKMACGLLNIKFSF